MNVRALFSTGLVLGLVACGSDVPSFVVTNQLTVAVSAGEVGSEDNRLPVAGQRDRSFTLSVTALDAKGNVDTTFDGWARISIKPGAVANLGGAAEVRGRNVRLVNGRAEGVVASFDGAFGDARVWVEDIGYVPVDPTRDPLPACSNGVDDDGNGFIDFPADPGCVFANDDTEGNGSRSAGASAPIRFAFPRVADVRGVSSGGAATGYPKQQVLVDTGWRARQATFVHSVVVTRIASDGFYVTDIDDPRGYGSIFAFTFGSPAGLRVCDRLYTLAGTAVDFYGFTELSFPTFSAEFWVPKTHSDGTPNPKGRDCLVPEPYSFTAGDLAATSAPVRFANESGLVRLESKGTDVLRIGKYLGRDKPAAPSYLPTANATNCDLNGDGTVDFYTEPEKTCSAACDADVDCTEYTNFRLRRTFQLVLVPGGDESKKAGIQGDSTTAASLDPLPAKGRQLRSFTGTLRYFSGGSQFTIETRCEDDLVVDLARAPVNSSSACVRPRADIDNDENSN
jgi:hypothetical protein